MDYSRIGQRIRNFRKARGLSQEELAEKVNISTTHMSHIETGATKLSLPVFVDLAEALGVRADELLYDRESAALETLAAEFDRAAAECSPAQARALAEIVRAARLAMDRYL